MYYFNLFVKKTLRYLLKPLSFVPAFAMMYLIFTFSAQSGEQSGQLSGEVSKYLVLAYNKVLGKGYSNDVLNQIIVQIHPLVRKFAHITEYFVLAITVALPLYVYRIRGFRLFLLGGLFCVLFACLDEYHQSFVAGRGPSLRDVGIDSIGIFAGILIAEFFCFIGRKTLFHSLSLENYRRKQQLYEQQQEDSDFDIH